LTANKSNKSNKSQRHQLLVLRESGNDGGEEPNSH